jgi:hypothetical protein
VSERELKNIQSIYKKIRSLQVYVTIKKSNFSVFRFWNVRDRPDGPLAARVSPKANLHNYYMAALTIFMYFGNRNYKIIISSCVCRVTIVIILLDFLFTVCIVSDISDISEVRGSLRGSPGGRDE